MSYFRVTPPEILDHKAWLGYVQPVGVVAEIETMPAPTAIEVDELEANACARPPGSGRVELHGDDDTHGRPTRDEGSDESVLNRS